MKTKIAQNKISGIQFNIHWSFILLIAWITLVNVLAAFKVEDIVWSLILLVSVLATIMVHDLAHIFTAAIFKRQPSEILLLPVGSVINQKPNETKPLTSIIILLSGPAVNLVIALIIKQFIHPYSAYWQNPENIGIVYRSNFWFQLQLINLGLGLFNLIPALPLDGGSILRVLLSLRLPLRRVNKIMSGITAAIVVGLFLFGVGAANVMFILLSVFLLVTWKAEESFEKKRKKLQLLDMNIELLNQKLKQKNSIESKYQVWN